MRILLTGATGYIGKRLLPVLREAGHQVICCVRNPEHFEVPADGSVEVFQVDLLEPVDLDRAPLDFDVAYYLIHSLSAAIDDFGPLEERAARHFRAWVDRSRARQVIYLTGIVNNDTLSEHLASRLRVEEILEGGRVPLTALRAGIIVGSGSASFEIIRDLVEKLPVMVAPKWVNTRCQPLAIRDVIRFLTGVLLREDCYHRNFDIGCADVLTYREMLLGYARVRGLRRWIFTVPVMTPRLSSYWLYFVTSTTYELAVNLVESMKIDVICRDDALARMLDLSPLPYEEAVARAFDKIEQHMVLSSWKDSLISSSQLGSLEQYMHVPVYGVFRDSQSTELPPGSADRVWQNVRSIGGDRGWYYADGLWKLRGFIDKLVGGIGLRRGRTHPYRLRAGDALDFWRVLVADPQQRRLLLYAEMRLPGEAWLEFSIRDKDGATYLHQEATFRPYGVMGRIYWYAMWPFHAFLFGGMARNLARYRSADTGERIDTSEGRLNEW